ncbi:MAG: hypothetical protein KDB66_00175 [Solirubrobacterales bacterium]|nr:hypothetical protein [Solirubrobacterales bacterium]MCB8915083.1 hypothetical protein [Thermoleophilales bacterium]
MNDQLYLLTHGIPAVIAGIMLALTLVGVTGSIWGIKRGLDGGERILRITAAILSLVGIGIAGYVVVTVEIMNQIPQCVGGGGGCAAVEHSSYSRIGGIHVSIFGLIGYSMLLISSFLKGDRARIGAFFLALFGFGFSLYLTYLEFWEILAVCQWCVSSAITMTMLFVVNTSRLIVFFGTDDEGDAFVPAEDPDPAAV